MTKVKDKMEIFKEVIESYPDSILKCITEKYNSSPDYINHLLRYNKTLKKLVEWDINEELFQLPPFLEVQPGSDNVKIVWKKKYKKTPKIIKDGFIEEFIKGFLYDKTHPYHTLETPFLWRLGNCSSIHLLLIGK